MKKLSMLQVLFAAGILFATNSTMYGEESSKPTKKECSKKKEVKESSDKKKVIKAEKGHENGKECMKKIEREINDLLKKFKKGKVTAQQANDQLDIISEKVTKAVRKMQKDDTHMWKVHKHTLERKVKEARSYIETHTK